MILVAWPPARTAWCFDPNEVPANMVVVYQPELNRHGRENRNLSAVRVGGDSMTPTISPGSIVVVDHDDREFVDKKIWCVRLLDDDLAAIKRVRKMARGLLLVSDNQDYMPVAIHEDWLDICVGRAI